MNVLPYKQTLDQELARIENELSSIASLDPATDDWVAVPETADASNDADENAHADLAESLEEREATVRALEHEYRDIKLALQKIITGTYGACEICSAPIEEKRLLFKPAARTCTAHMNNEQELPL